MISNSSCLPKHINQCNNRKSCRIYFFNENDIIKILNILDVKEPLKFENIRISMLEIYEASVNHLLLIIALSCLEQGKLSQDFEKRKTSGLQKVTSVKEVLYKKE